MGIELVPYEESHAQPREMLLEGMQGITILKDGTPIASGGTFPLEGRTEAWIQVKDGLSPADRLTVARVARSYLGVLLGRHDHLHATTFAGDENIVRWMKWLGFQKNPQPCSVDRYVLEA